MLDGYGKDAREYWQSLGYLGVRVGFPLPKES